jgi:transcriptional regulator with XRE-family HTH domain
MSYDELDIDEIIRDRLIKAVGASGMTQGEITKKAKLGEVTLNRLLTGARKGTTNATLAKIANVLELPVSYFFGETNITDNSQNTNTGDINVTGGDGNQFITGSNIQDSNIKNGPQQPLNPKHKQILELLPYANEAFLNKLIESLTKTKEDQDKLFG